MTPGEVLERFCASFTARDADAVFALFAPDDDVVMVTSEEPLLRGRAEIGSFLARYAAGETVYGWTWRRVDVSQAGETAWLLAEGTETEATGNDREEHPYRMTMVCERRDGRWLLRQAHGSSPH